MADIGGSGATFLLTVPGVFSAPQAIQGYASDDSFATQSIKRAETLMGVDGVLSGGLIKVARTQSIHLQADSDSQDVFDQWDEAENASGLTIPASAVIILPGISRKWTMVKGFLTDFVPIPPVKRLLQPRDFIITWQNMRVAPA